MTPYEVVRLSASRCHFQQCPYRGMFCVNRKGGTGGAGWVHPKGANSMAMSGLHCRKGLVGTDLSFLETMHLEISHLIC